MAQQPDRKGSQGPLILLGLAAGGLALWLWSRSKPTPPPPPPPPPGGKAEVRQFQVGYRVP